MPVEATLVLASIMVLIIFQLIDMAQQCDLRRLAVYHPSSRPSFQKLGRFGSLHMFNIYLSSFTYYIVAGALAIFLSENGVNLSPVEYLQLSLLLSLLGIVFIIMIILPTIEIAEYNLPEMYGSYGDIGFLKRLKLDLKANDSSNAHFLMVMFIGTSPLTGVALALIGKLIGIPPIISILAIVVASFAIITKLIDIFLLKLQYELLTEF